LTTSSIGKHAGQSAFYLGIRQIFVHAVNITGGIILARVLAPADFGVFAIFTFLIGIGSAICDMGLGASLIQQKLLPEIKKINAIFTFQLSLALVLTIFIWFISPAIIHLYHQISLGIVQLRMLSFLLVFNVFLSLNTALLERKLAFSRLSIIEIALAVLYQGIMVLCAFHGFGVWSFVLGSLARSLCGAVAMSIASGYVPHFTWNFTIVRPNVRFGFFYQSNGFVSMIKDSLVPTFVGLMLGTASVGYIGWAGVLSGYPILLISALNRIYLPFFSRLAADKIQIAKLLEKILLWSNRVVAPLSLAIIVFAYPITLTIYKADWLPAVPLMIIFCIGNIFTASSGPCLGLLNATGNPQRTLIYTSLWAVMNWVFGVPLIKLFGLVGFGIANLLVSFSNIFLFLDCQKRIRFQHWQLVVLPWATATSVAALFFLVTKHFPVTSVATLLVDATGFFAVYSLALFIFQPKQILADIKTILPQKDKLL
jgi:O-antigen/teichoic acid export membrane protein